MTPTRSDIAQPSEADLWRRAAQAQAHDADRPWSEVRHVEIFPDVALGDALLVVPELWMPPGDRRRANSRTLDPSLGGRLGQGDPEHVEARDESVRRALLALWLPRRTNTGTRVYKPNSWLTQARLLLRAVAWQIDVRPSSDGSVWRHLSLADLRALEDHLCVVDVRRARVRNLFRYLNDAGARGVLIDFPRLDQPQNSRVRAEASNRGDPIAPAARRPQQSWQPFEGPFITELLWRALWMQRNLAGQLLDCWSGLRGILARAANREPNASDTWAAKEVKRLMASITWCDAQGRPIEQLPFEVSQWFGNRTVRTSAWPPRDARTVNLMVGLLQSLNFATMAFCTGARPGELLSADDDSLPGLAAGRLTARTFKLASEVEGKVRDWPLHPAAIQALVIQHDLARRVRPPEARHLWVLAGRSGDGPVGSPLRNVSMNLQNAVRHLGLGDLAGEAPPHAHRWRHTVGRFVALSVNEAPMVLVDLFGHADLEMTLTYMLSDPRIAEEAIRVAEEAAVALAEEAVGDTLAGATSGPAAVALEQGVAWAMRRGEAEFGADSLRELAEVLTMSGRQWHLVRPGVICTKGPGEAGSCTRTVGEPDLGACRTTCDHRLETRAAEAQCDETIGSLLTETEAALADGADLLAANLRGQVLAQLHRWESVRLRWMSRSALAARIWAER